MKKSLLKSLLAVALLLVCGNVWGEATTYSFTITATDFNTSSYAANNGSHTSTATCTTDDTKTMDVVWTSNQVYQNSSVMQWQKNNGYIFNVTDLGAIISVTVNETDGSFTTYYGTSANPTSGTTVGNGYFNVKVGNATGKTSSIVVTFTVGGGDTPTGPVDDTTFGFANSVVNVDLNATSVPTNTLTYATDGAITYSSSNTSVATVNSSTGVVALVAAGTTTITASAAATSTYNAATASYTLNVTEPTPLSEYATVYTSNVTLSTTGGTSATLAKVKFAGDETGAEYNAIKAGTGKVMGTAIVSVPVGTTTLHVHIAAWNGENVSLNVKNGEESITSIALTADEGINGSETTYILVGTPSSYYYAIDVSDYTIEDDVNIAFEVVSGKRFVIFGVNAEGADTPITEKTLTSISVSGTAADLWTKDDFTHEGITVTANWSDDSQTDVTDEATYSGYDMNIFGNQTVTVAYEGKETSYTVNVYTIANTQAEAYTVAQAKARIDAGKGLKEKVYVGGTISEISEFSTQYGNATYKITDGEESMTVFRGKYLNNASFTSESQLVENATVIVYGGLTLYNNETYEIASGNYLVSYEEPEAEKYDIVIEELTNGTITTDPADEAFAGQQVTLTITPAEHYQLKANTLIVMDNELNEYTVTDNKFTMPATDVTISAEFESKAKYCVLYTTLGEEAGEEEVYDGEYLTSVPSVTAPNGWTFVGWTENDEYTMSTTAPALLNINAPVTGDLMLYAVFSQSAGSGVSSLTKMTSTDTFADGDKVVIVTNNTKKGLYQETVSTSYVAAFDFDGKAETISSDEKNWWTVSTGRSEGTWKLGDDTNGYLYNASSNNLTADTNNYSDWTLNYDEDKEAFTLRNGERWLSNRSDLTGANQYKWRCGGTNPISGDVYFDIYKFVASGNATYYATTIKTQEISVSAVGYATASVPFKATVSGVTAYTVKVGSDGLELTPITVIPAGAGVLLESLEGGAATAIFTESCQDADDLNGSELRGNPTDEKVIWSNEEGGDDKFYILANGKDDAHTGGVGFYWQKDTQGKSVKCGAYKAALVVSATKSAKTIGNDGEESGELGSNAVRGWSLNGTTLVEQMLQENEDNVIYDLQGRQVENATKGLYIMGGKKVFVK